MGRKLSIDSAITTDIKSVASDSFKDNIQMIEIEKIKMNLDNFYSLSDIESLADDIERQGLKHNLVVVEDIDNAGTFFIKSGHRRFTAIQKLVSENRYGSNYIPCLVDGIKSKDEMLLDLIMLNATTRVMSDSELYKQYEVLKDTLERIKADGIKIKGRMREKLADALNVSAAQIGKIENIKHNAVEEVKDAVSNGDMTIATADSIAKLPEEEQEEMIAEKPVAEITSKDVKERKEKKTSPKEKADPVAEKAENNSEDVCDNEVEMSNSDQDNDEGKDNNEPIELPSDEEERAAAEKFEKLLRWAQTVSQEQLDFLLDGGWYNSAMKGYLLIAAEEASLTKEQKKSLLVEFGDALSNYNKVEAEKKYLNY